jgi:hypothetical protein
MSVRAYRILNIKYEMNPTFNLWHDDFIMEYLPMHTYTEENGEAHIIEIEKEAVEKTIKDFSTLWKEYCETCTDKTENTKFSKKYYKDILQQMLNECEATGYTRYLCF